MSELYAPKLDTAAILGIKGLAESMSELYTPSSTAIGIKGLAESMSEL